MKMLPLIFALLIMMVACATDGGNRIDPQMTYGGTYRVRVIAESVP